MALRDKITVLIGGVGGAKLALGLAEVVSPERLTFIVNTGDDFWHLGLKICPDLDTLMYTLAGLVDPQRGWGLINDTSHTLDSLERCYQVEPWFRLGDQDLATHLLRSHWLREGHSLTKVTARLTERLDIGACILPMTDAEMPTLVDTLECGTLGFQEYFVKYAWAPVLRAIRHKGCDCARLSELARSAMLDADIILIAPSNPWLSLAPILAIPGMRALLSRVSAPVVAVTPIIGGEAVKGPTAKIMRELGLEVSARSVADFYAGLIDGFIDDLRNEPFAGDGLRTTQMDTLMSDLSKKRALARGALEWIGGWAA
ncbi:MAG: 2-phospho-L-lactate transferase [Chloroflexi bacterium]|nr:2-phospho-L-lactate transferase [Chloroflexota bacterium]